ncbi:hypothetical protein HAX54_039695, partial [Datura stramonium]|nr:hypothetical protein [Datura stramonium]
GIFGPTSKGLTKTLSVKAKEIKSNRDAPENDRNEVYVPPRAREPVASDFGTARLEDMMSRMMKKDGATRNTASAWTSTTHRPTYEGGGTTCSNIGTRSTNIVPTNDED